MTDPVVIELPPSPVAVAIARRFVAEHCTSLETTLLQDAELLVSELVTNAVVHGRPSIVLQVRPDPPGIGIEVRDEGDADPLVPEEEPALVSPSGRGLRMVAALASSWGVRRSEDGPGKVVWFTLRPSNA